MTDYDKLTVIRLREELVKRGLPKTGLKAVLVQRLQEADAQSRGANALPDEKATEPRDQDAQAEESAPQTAPTPPAGIDHGLKNSNQTLNDEAPQASEATSHVEEDASGFGKSEAPTEKFLPGEQEPEVIVRALQNEQFPAQTSGDTETPMSSSEPTNLVQENSQDDVLPGVMTQPAQEPESTLQLPTPIQTQSEQSSITPALGTQELMEDSRKRKRRSQSPPPLTIETQKRLKAHNDSPHVELPEDSAMKDSGSDHQSDGPTSPKANPEPEPTPHLNGHASITNRSLSQKRNGTSDEVEIPNASQESITNVQAKNAESPLKTSPSDARFKTLFSAPSKPDHSPQRPSHPDTEDRIISPALHPASSALYIRELMRPLKPESIREQLIALATPADCPAEPSIITDFFLDSIRTHCLVGFANISAASRVRSGLHDRIWPNERDRRPLFVDFVPEEKLQKWINIEQNASSGRGQPQKRWEVVYEDEDGAIKAYLQEVGSGGGGGIRAAPPAKGDTGHGVKGAPSGPRIRDPEPRATQARPDNGKGFQALDDLFKSTTAKPKLYYLPVPKKTADNRLDRLRAGRGGGRSDEMRRYTFEDDLLVDKAPEFGNRGRGGYGGRGGPSASHRGRGGSYRRDGYRGASDNWRDRRSGY